MHAMPCVTSTHNRHRERHDSAYDILVRVRSPGFRTTLTYTRFFFYARCWEKKAATDFRLGFFGRHPGARTRKYFPPSRVYASRKVIKKITFLSKNCWIVY